MKFVFTDKKVTLPASVHAYAEKKVGKMDRYFKNEGRPPSSLVLKRAGTSARSRSAPAV